MNLVDVEADLGEGSEIKYAVKVRKLIFTKDELQNGIFPLPNGKSRSKDRVAFDPERVAILKGLFIKIVYQNALYLVPGEKKN